MKRFKKDQVNEAKEHALAGHQALHVWTPPGKPGMRHWPRAPTCFQRANKWAHLFDQDKERLVKTAKRLGVRVIYIHHEGTERQHIDLCGRPLAKAVEECCLE